VINKNTNLYLKHLIFLVPFLSLLVIFFVSLAQGKSEYLQFYFLEADSFYYFSIASEKAFSFDNVYLSNGYHPFWQIFLVLLSKLGVSKLSLLVTALLTNLLFLTFSLFIFYKMFYKKIKTNPLIVFLIVPGVQFLFLLPTNQQNYLHFFSFINGMESSLTILLTTLLIYSLRKKNINTLIVGILLLLIVLTRLDNVFLIISYSVIKILKTKKILHKEIIISLLGISVYLILNKFIFGTFLPAVLLNNFSLNLINNYSVIFNTFISNLDYSLDALNMNIFENLNYWKIIQVYLPFLLSTYLYFIIKKSNHLKFSYANHFLFFVFFKSIYSIFTTKILAHGQWHFPASFVIISFLLIEYSSDIKNFLNLDSFVKSIITVLIVNWSALFIFRSIDTYSKSIDLFEIIYIPIIIIFIAICTVTLTSLFYNTIFKFKRKTIFFIVYLLGFNFIHINHFNDSQYNLENYKFFKQHYEINNTLKKVDNYNQKLLSLDYGIVNFYINSEVMNGFLIDPSAQTKEEVGSIYDIAYSRGYRFFGSLNYLSDFDLVEGSHFMDEKTFNKYDIKIVYESEENNFLVFQFIEK